MTKYIFAIGFVFFLDSCTPYRKLLYLQGEPIEKENLNRVDNAPYKLRTNDVIAINIASKNPEFITLFNNNVESELEPGYSVDENGNIQLPYLGDVNVLGYTVDEVKDKIKSELKYYITLDKSVLIDVSLAGIQYTMLGEASSGVITAAQSKLNIIDAIANAGGVPPTGDLTAIEVIREEDGGIKKYTVDLTQMNAYNSEVYYILPHDIIYVHPLKNKAWGVGTTALSSLTSIVSLITIVTTVILLTERL